MDHHEPNPDPELLLAQVEWVRGLARALVGDPERANDLAQTAMLAALRRPPAGIESPRRLRAWFARVLANGAREERRGEAQRRRREADAASVEPQDSAAEIVERASTHRAVVAAVLELPEPYRATILWRFFDGLSIANIAARSDASELAVRKRLSRAVAMLRAALAPRDERETRTWTLALCALARGDAVAKPVSVGTAAGMKPLLAASLLLLPAAALALSLHGRETAMPDATPVPARVSSSTSQELPLPAAVAALRVDPGQGAAGDAALVVVAAETGERIEGAEVRTADRSTRAELEERVASELNALGIAPDAGRWLELAGEEAIPPDPSAPDEPPCVPRALELVGTTDAQGRLPLGALRDATEEAAGFLVSHPERAPVFVARAWLEREGTQSLELALPARSELRVRIVDAVTGAPVARGYARVELESGGNLEPEPRPQLDPLRWHGPTDAAGWLAIEGAPAGASLWVTPLGEFSGRPFAIRLAARAGQEQCELRVWRVGGVRGRFVRPDGTPAAGVFVGWRDPWAMTVFREHGSVADERGEFRLEDVVAGWGRVAALSAPGHGRPIVSRDVEVPAGETVDLGDLVVPELVSVTGRILAPCEWTAGQVQMEVWSAGVQRQSGGMAPDGSFAHAVPAGPHELVVLVHDGWHRRALVRRIVVAPAEGVEIDIGSVIGGLRARLPSGFPDVPAIARLLDRAPSDAPEWPSKNTILRNARMVEGELDVPLLPPGEYDVELSFGDLGSARIADVVIEPGRVRDLGELSVGGGTLAGVVRDAHGEPLAGATVQLAAPSIESTHPTGPQQRRDTVTDAEGRYRLRAIDARAWRAWAVHPELGASAVHDVSVSNDALTTHDFELAAACFVRGRATRRGVPVSDATVSGVRADIIDFDPGPGPGSSVRVEEDGTFELGPFLPGEYVVVLQAGSSTSKRLVRLAPGGDASLDFELEVGLRRLQLESGGEPLEHLVTLWALCIDPRSPDFGMTSFGRICGVGLVELELPRAPVALRLSIGGYDVTCRIYVFVDGSKLEDGATVALPEGVLELALPPDRRVGERPGLFVLGVGTAALAERDARKIRHPAEQGVDCVRFPCLAPGTRCLIVGPGLDGAITERVVTYVGPGVQRETWE